MQDNTDTVIQDNTDNVIQDNTVQTSIKDNVIKIKLCSYYLKTKIAITPPIFKILAFYFLDGVFL